MGMFGNKVQTVWKFSGMGEFLEYCDKHPEGRDTLSPGGAAAELGVTRQQVYNLIKAGKLRAWFVYECGNPCFDVPGNRASYVFVSCGDVALYAVTPKSKGGRPLWKGQQVAA
jgi:excisionase family DNA binding protein